MFFYVYGGKRMLSKKLTFSLTCLVMLLAIGLVFAPSVLADKDNNKTYWDLSVAISEAESMIDVSDKDGIQIESGRTRSDRRLNLDGDTTYSVLTGSPAAPSDTGDVIQLSVRFGDPVNLESPGGSFEDVEEATEARGDTKPGEPSPADSGGNFGADDMFAAAFDVDGRQLGVLPLKDVAGIEAEFTDAARPGQDFLVTINQARLLNAYRTFSAGTTVDDSGFEVSKLVFFIPKAQSGVKDKALDEDDVDAKVTRGIRKADLGHAIAHFGPDAHQHLNEASNRFEIELVDKDEGDPEYAKIASSSTATDVYDDTSAATIAATTGIPGVVSIMRTASRTGFIETGAFEVRIILTEEPGNIKSILADPTVLVDVENGKAAKIVKGVTYKGGHPAIGAQASWHAAITKRASALGAELIDYYGTGDDGADAPAKIAATDSTPDDGTDDGFPQATGRDNKYYSFIATIQPNPSLSDKTVMVSIKEFPDFKKPIANRYIPLTKGQMSATQLTSAALNVRDARLKNETLSVRVSTGADTTSEAAVLNAAYEARKKDKGDTAGIFDNAPNVKEITAELVIPAGGYLVLATGKDTAASGIADPKAKLAEKLLAAQKKYNLKPEFSLPAPADNLSDFFRNGGTLTLAYSDIPQATTAKNADGKLITAKTGDAAKGGKDATGYYGATTNAYTKGSVVISEIMWGLDIDAKTSQYIELHNPGTTDIGIDKLEWVIAVGEAPSGFTVIDTVSNVKDPVTGKYWSPPGANGVTKADTANPTTKSLVSMSRISGTAGADGTAAASWAPSILPSVNLSGLRVGTPGAANNADTSAQDAAAKAAADKAKADAAAAVKTPANVATASDLKITEIMVASNEGRLPQWIEITNVSVGAVSLNGWVVGIDNASDDADVVASSLSIKLDDVTLGEGQSALVVSKTGRNSGVSARAPKDNNAGDLDSARIVDAHSQIKPASKVYSMLSEMSFRISLEPPLPLAGGVSDRGDVVGNLGGGWELEMSEGNRSSLIRREMGKTAEIMGTDAAGWVLASETSLIGAYVSTYYGDKDDVGTPGYNAGGALPVELSKFGAKRDPLTGQVVVTWETQSELNNAGFYIKRAEHKTAKFVPVNPTLIPGAGTTSEKQSYTYTDTTAKPNIVYYYQIEDVSLDGNRQTLTRAHRLKGHVGAAGKLTTMWGELKEQE